MSLFHNELITFLSKCYEKIWRSEISQLLYKRLLISSLQYKEINSFELNIPSLGTGGAYPHQQLSEETKRNIEGHRRVCSCRQLTTSKSLTESKLQKKEQKEMKDLVKATETAREA